MQVFKSLARIHQNYASYWRTSYTLSKFVEDSEDKKQALDVEQRYSRQLFVWKQSWVLAATVCVE